MIVYATEEKVNKQSTIKTIADIDKVSTDVI